MARQRSELGLALILLLLGLTLTGSAYWIVASSIDRLVRKDAEQTAVRWAGYLSTHLADIDRIAAGDAPSAGSAEFIERARSIGNVFRFKIFSADGRLRLVSDEPGRRWDAEPPLAAHNPAAASTLAAGRIFTTIQFGTPPERPLVFAETYLPLPGPNGTRAIVEVYLDQTKAQALYQEHFTNAAGTLALLTALAFGVPGAAFYARSRQKRRGDARIAHLADHDGLTGLLNRTAFVARLDALLARPDGEEPLALLYVDLDRFKEVNDTLGHNVGDELLTVVAKRLAASVRSEDLLARLGGDEFVLALRLSGSEDAGDAARRIVARLAEPASISGHDVAMSASVGVALSPAHGRTALDLFKNADLALYAAKAAGRSRWEIFTPNMDMVLKARLKREATIRAAAETEGFELYFQPLVTARDGELTGFEALLRLADGDGGFIPPSEFIPLAEEMGLINKIGAWVLRRACAVAATWPAHLGVSVNLSPRQFEGEELVGTVAAALEESGLAPERLELEITEGVLLRDTAATLAKLQQLKTLNVRVAMDDFGTGYSSLSYLWRFPFDKIKIDRGFMQAFQGRDEQIESILRTIVALGRTLHMEVTAEGVETAGQASLLRSIECDYIQGYHFGRPLPELDVAERIDSEPSVSMKESAHAAA